MEKFDYKKVIRNKEFHEVITEAMKASVIFFGFDSEEKLEDGIKKFLTRNSFWAANCVGGYEPADMKNFIDSIRVDFSNKYPEYPLNGVQDTYRISFGTDSVVYISVRDIYYNPKGFDSTHEIVCQIKEVKVA